MTVDMADVKPTVVSWIIVGLMAVTFIAAAKWVTARYPVPYITDLIQAV